MSTAAHAHDDRVAVTQLVAAAAIEIIPLKGAASQLALIPGGSTVTITCSVKLGLDRTLDLAAAAAAAGHRVVPHLAARQVAGEAELRRVVGRLDDLGITDLYVIGGDAPEPAGDYRSTGDLLEALSEIDHGITRIGVACYPEGHPSISDANLTSALLRAQPHVHYLVSQLCFNPTAITHWLQRTRAEGITLPLHLGLAAPMQIRKLAELSLKIGVGSSIRYLTKQHGLVGSVLRGASYRPEDLLFELGGALTSPAAGIEGLHLFTFNQVAATLAWQGDLAGGLNPPPPGAPIMEISGL